MNMLSLKELLSLIPQQRPMRFIDDILEVDTDHILGTYVWKEEDCRGNSPDGRTVPAFKLIEMAAQVGNVAWCIYHMALTAPLAYIRKLTGVMTEVEGVKVKNVVRAGDRVSCFASFSNDGYFRGNKLVSEVKMRISGGVRDGQEVFAGLISGLWIPRIGPQPQ